MIAWIIGFILSLLGIWLFKNSRIPASIKWEGCLYEKEIPPRPILKVWTLILLLIGSVMPLFNIVEGSIMVILWAVLVLIRELEFTKGDNKIIKFLNKPVK